MVDFHLSVWLQERERENDHVGMRSLIILFSHSKVFLSFWSREKIESSSTFSRKPNGKSHNNHSNRSAILCTLHCFPIENQIFIFPVSRFPFFLVVLRSIL